MKNYRVTVNGNVYDVCVEELDDAQLVQPSQPVHKPSVKPNTAAPQVTKASGGGTKLNSPMPGVVLDVKVAVGDTVNKHQVAVILESMKMENEVVTPTAGKISSILVSKGSSVESGDVLLTIE